MTVMLLDERTLYEIHPQARGIVENFRSQVRELADFAVVSGVAPFAIVQVLEELVSEHLREGWREKTRSQIVAAIEKRTT